jgi:hypothetical protein
VLIHLVKTALYDSSVDPAIELLDKEASDLDARLRGLTEQVILSGHVFKDCVSPASRTPLPLPPDPRCAAAELAGSLRASATVAATLRWRGLARRR